MENLSREKEDGAADNPKKKALAWCDARFSTEAACREFFFRIRWPQGYRCPHGKPPCRQKLKDPTEGLISRRCGRCKRRVHFATGTLLEGTRIPLLVWFRAAYLIACQGIVAVGDLKATLGLKRYATAWHVRNVIHQACVLSQRELRGMVGVGACTLPGWKSGLWVAVEIWWHAPGQVRLAAQVGAMNLSFRSFLSRYLQANAMNEGLVFCELPDCLGDLALKLGYKLLADDNGAGAARKVVRRTIATLLGKIRQTRLRKRMEVQSGLAAFSYWYDRRRLKPVGVDDLLEVLCRPLKEEEG